MAYSVTIDIIKKNIFSQNDKYYVRFEALIVDLESNISELHHKCLFVTDDYSLPFNEVDKLATDTMINFKVATENQ